MGDHDHGGAGEVDSDRRGQREARRGLLSRAPAQGAPELCQAPDTTPEPGSLGKEQSDACLILSGGPLFAFLVEEQLSSAFFGLKSTLLCVGRSFMFHAARWSDPAFRNVTPP